MVSTGMYISIILTTKMCTPKVSTKMCTHKVSTKNVYTKKCTPYYRGIQSARRPHIVRQKMFHSIRSFKCTTIGAPPSPLRGNFFGGKQKKKEKVSKGAKRVFRKKKPGVKKSRVPRKKGQKK